MKQTAEITKLMGKILEITMEIKDTFPELYQNLNEAPLFNFKDKKELDSNDFKEYLNTIQSQLKLMRTF